MNVVSVLDNDGLISLAELADRMKSVGSGVSDAEAKRIIERVRYTGVSCCNPFY
jgi:Ca2+-binding EF-hand superfamily protein